MSQPGGGTGGTVEPDITENCRLHGPHNQWRGVIIGQPVGNESTSLFYEIQNLLVHAMAKISKQIDNEM